MSTPLLVYCITITTVVVVGAALVVWAFLSFKKPKPLPAWWEHHPEYKDLLARKQVLRSESLRLARLIEGLELLGSKKPEDGLAKLYEMQTSFSDFERLEASKAELRAELADTCSMLGVVVGKLEAIERLFGERGDNRTHQVRAFILEKERSQ